MEYITSSDFHFKDTAVALGKIEGIHRGHQLLMDEVKKQELVLLFFYFIGLGCQWILALGSITNRGGEAW